MDQAQFNEMIDALIVLGGTLDELELWRAIYPTLTVEKQLQVSDNLTKELNELAVVQ